VQLCLRSQDEGLDAAASAASGSINRPATVDVVEDAGIDRRVEPGSALSPARPVAINPPCK
jgi:hypothetical protein